VPLKFFPYAQNFITGIFDFKISFRQKTFFESYPGPFFRSVLGKVLKESLCDKKETACINCHKRDVCIYSILHDAPHNKKINIEFDMSETNFPKPFFMTPITDYPYEYKDKDRIMTVEVVLIGNALKYLKEVVSYFSEAGNHGVDKKRFEFDLISVSDSLIGKEIFKNGKFLTEKMTAYSVIPEENEMELTSIGIHLFTPLVLTSRHMLIDDIHFSDIWTTLVRRIILLTEVYGGKMINLENVKKSIDISKGVKKEQERIHLIKLSRYSATQQKIIPLSGYTGKFVFSGVPKGFLPILKMGEIIHIGKGLTSGLGKYKLNIKNNRIIIAGRK